MLAACGPPAAQVHAMVAKQIAHIYNQIATDGEDSLGSYVAKATVRRGSFAVSIQTHVSTYDSQHNGPATLTIVHTIAGSDVSVPWFRATDRTSEVHAAACTHFDNIYVGLGYVQAQSSYAYPIGYGALRGVGAGLERFADTDRRLDTFGSLYYYPSASGAYGTGRVTFAIVSFDGGIRWRPGHSRIGVVAGLYQEMRTMRPGNRAGYMIRDGPYIGVDL